MNRMQPLDYAVWPGSHRERSPAQAISVSALSIDVQFGGNLGALESKEVDRGILDTHRIILSLHDEAGRRLGGDMDLRIWCEVLVGEREVAGINDHGEVGTAVNRVCLVDRIIQPLIEMRAERRGKMCSSRKAKNANPVGINM